MRSALTFLPVLLLLFAACGDGKQEVADALAAQDSTATVLSVDLGPQDIPLFVELGDAATLGVEAPTVVWNEEMGRLELDAGDHFAITIVEESGDLARLKADLDRDMLQKHTMIEEGPGKAVYRSQFPDDELVFVHFYQLIETPDGRAFVVQDNTKGRFNEADIARMAKAVRTQRAV